MIRRDLLLLIFLALGYATPLPAQPTLPNLFDFPVPTGLPPELAGAGSYDVRVRVWDAHPPNPLLYQEISKGLPIKPAKPFRVRVGYEKELPRNRIQDRPVRYDVSVKKKAVAEFGEPIYTSPEYRFLFEQPKSIWEKVRLDQWVLLGLLGQIVFMLRFFIQWIETERRRESVVPVAFWYCSLVGGLIVLAYGIIEREPIIILGQSTGFIIYLRNLSFIHKKRAETANGAIDGTDVAGLQ